MPFEPKLRFLKIIWRVISFFLGGACYIHLTMGTNAVFSGFSAFSVTATNFMNSITFVMNHLISYFDISICHCSNRTLCYHLFKFHGFNYGYFLGGPRYIHLTKETNTWLLIQKPCFILPFFFKMHKSLEPDYSAESSSSLWYSQQILLIDADIQNDAV